MLNADRHRDSIANLSIEDLDESPRAKYYRNDTPRPAPLYEAPMVPSAKLDRLLVGANLSHLKEIENSDLSKTQINSSEDASSDDEIDQRRFDRLNQSSSTSSLAERDPNLPSSTIDNSPFKPSNSRSEGFPRLKMLDIKQDINPAHFAKTGIPPVPIRRISKEYSPKNSNSAQLQTSLTRPISYPNTPTKNYLLSPKNESPKRALDMSHNAGPERGISRSTPMFNSTQLPQRNSGPTTRSASRLRANKVSPQHTDSSQSLNSITAGMSAPTSPMGGSLPLPPINPSNPSPLIFSGSANELPKVIPDVFGLRGGSRPEGSVLNAQALPRNGNNNPTVASPFGPSTSVTSNELAPHGIGAKRLSLSSYGLNQENNRSSSDTHVPIVFSRRNSRNSSWNNSSADVPAITIKEVKVDAPARKKKNCCCCLIL